MGLAIRANISLAGMGLRPEHFCSDIRDIARAVIEMQSMGQWPEREALASILERGGSSCDLDAVMLNAQLIDVSECNARFYADAIIDRYHRLEMFRAADRLVQCAEDPSSDSAKGRADAVEILSGCCTTGSPSVTLREGAEELIEHLTHGTPDYKSGVPTGIASLDRVLTYGGLPRGLVTILAGATSAGKSALAITACLGAAKSGARVLVATLEDSAASAVRRIVSQESGVRNEVIQSGAVGQRDMSRISDAVNGIKDLQIRFIENTKDSEDLCNNLRGYCLRDQSDLIVVDFLQLVPPTGRHQKRQDAADEVFERIVRLGRDTGAAVLAVSQLRRTRGSRPTKEDLYHSGALEQQAHTVGLLWRPQMKGYNNMVILNIAKQKQGKVCDIPLGWHGETVSYQDPQPGVAESYLNAVEEYEENGGGSWRG